MVKVRSGSRVERVRYEKLGAAIDALESRGRELERDADGGTIDLKVMRRFEPVQRVVARLELAGPRRLRAGVDVRGDGSAEAYTGVVRRRLVEQRGGESPYDALRRAIGAT
jgi:hypothetical protein